MQDPKTNTEGKTPEVTTTTTDTSSTVTPEVTAVSSTETAVPTPVADATTPAAETAVTTTETSSSEVSVVTPSVTTEEAVASPAAPSDSAVAAVHYRRQVITQYAIAFGIIFIIAGALLYVMEKQGRVHTGLLEKVDSLVALAVPEKAAATVNGVKLTMTQYETTLNQLATSYQVDMTNASASQEVRQMAIDQLITTELLRQAAVAAGVTVTDEEVEQRYQDILEKIGSEEELTKRMQELGITPASLRRDIHDEILIQQNLSKSISTTTQTVSDEELKAAYDEQVKAAPAGQKVPTFAEVKDMFKAQLVQQKVAAEQQQLIQGYIKTLKDKADIKILI